MCSRLVRQTYVDDGPQILVLEEHAHTMRPRHVVAAVCLETVNAVDLVGVLLTHLRRECSVKLTGTPQMRYLATCQQEYK